MAHNGWKNPEPGSFWERMRESSNIAVEAARQKAEDAPATEHPYINGPTKIGVEPPPRSDFITFFDPIRGESRSIDMTDRRSRQRVV